MTERGPVADSAAMVVVLTRDVMARIRIGDLLRQVGYASRFAGDSAAFVEAIGAAADRIALGVIDMNGPIDWEAIAALTRRPDRPPMLGFGPHVDVAGRRAAKSAGVDRIVANGEFHRDAARIDPSVRAFGRVGLCLRGICCSLAATRRLAAAGSRSAALRPKNAILRCTYTLGCRTRPPAPSRWRGEAVGDDGESPGAAKHRVGGSGPDGGERRDAGRRRRRNGGAATIAGAVELFFGDLRLAPRSKKTYRHGVAKFLRHLADHEGIDPETAPVTALRPEHVTQFAALLVPPDVRTPEEVSRMRTAQNNISAVRKFCAYLSSYDFNDRPLAATGSRSASRR